MKKLFITLLSLIFVVSASYRAEAEVTKTPVAFHFTTVGDCRGDPLLAGSTEQDLLWVQSTKVLARMIREMQKGLGKEVARTKTKMRVPESKAEAVTVLAEIETDINTAKERAAGNGLRQSFDKPDQLMTESKSQLEQGHYDRACSLAGEALEMVQAMELKTEPSARPRTGPAINYVFPLVMQLSGKSNVREYPSRNAKIVHILNQGTTVTATGHERRWIKIAINNKPLGWIHYSLLTLPEI